MWTASRNSLPSVSETYFRVFCRPGASSGAATHPCSACSSEWQTILSVLGRLRGQLLNTYLRTASGKFAPRTSVQKSASARFILAAPLLEEKGGISQATRCPYLPYPG